MGMLGSGCSEGLCRAAQPRVRREAWRQRCTGGLEALHCLSPGSLQLRPCHQQH